jgi:hypothetical protein
LVLEKAFTAKEFLRCPLPVAMALPDEDEYLLCDLEKMEEMESSIKVP